MYAKNVLAVSGALLSAVAAVPMANKRDIVWVTHTDVVLETVQATSTVWVNPGEQSTATVTSAATPSHYGHAHHSPASSSSVQPASPSSVAQSSSSSSSSSSTYVAPTTTSSSSSSSTSVYVAPTTPSTTYVAPATTSEPATTSTPITTSSSSSSSSVVTTSSSTSSSSTAAAAATSSSSSSGSPSGDVLTGEATYYTPGLGSCGTDATENDPVVAISYKNMDNGANSNNNPNCNKWINIEYNGKTASAKVVDTCPGCALNGIDLSPVVFEQLADLSVGRLHGVTWSYQS